MGLKGLLDRNDEPSDIESEREALRRQRAEAAEELATLKRTLSERVARVQQRERELGGRAGARREARAEARHGRGARLAARSRCGCGSPRRKRRAPPPTPARRSSTRASRPRRSRQALRARRLGASVVSTQAPLPAAGAAKELAARRRRSPTAPRSWTHGAGSTKREWLAERARERDRSQSGKPSSRRARRVETRAAEPRRRARRARAGARRPRDARSTRARKKVLFQHKLPSRAGRRDRGRARGARGQAGGAGRGRAGVRANARGAGGAQRRAGRARGGAGGPRARARREGVAGNAGARGARRADPAPGAGRPQARGRAADVQRRPARPPGAAASAPAGRRTSLYTESRVRGVSSAGRAPRLQRGGRRFDPGTLHFWRKPEICGSRFLTREDP